MKTIEGVVKIQREVGECMGKDSRREVWRKYSEGVVERFDEYIKRSG